MIYSVGFYFKPGGNLLGRVAFKSHTHQVLLVGGEGREEVVDPLGDIAGFGGDGLYNLGIDGLEGRMLAAVELDEDAVCHPPHPHALLPLRLAVHRVELEPEYTPHLLHHLLAAGYVATGKVVADAPHRLLVPPHKRLVVLIPLPAMLLLL